MKLDRYARPAAIVVLALVTVYGVTQFLTGDWSTDSGFEAGERLLHNGLPDAVFVANDLMALGLLAAFHDHGVRVPEDVAVAGFDGIPGCEAARPSLTTVSQPLHALGEACVGALLGRGGDGKSVEEGDEAGRTIPPTLTVRQSTAVL